MLKDEQKGLCQFRFHRWCEKRSSFAHCASRGRQLLLFFCCISAFGSIVHTPLTCTWHCHLQRCRCGKPTANRMHGIHPRDVRNVQTLQAVRLEQNVYCVYSSVFTSCFCHPCSLKKAHTGFAVPDRKMTSNARNGRQRKMTLNAKAVVKVHPIPLAKGDPFR